MRIELSASLLLLPNAVRAEERWAEFDEQADPLETYMPSDER